MAYREIKYGCYKKEIRELLRERLKLLDRENYHLAKIKLHEDRIKEILEVKIPEVEKKLDKYLERTK